MGRWVMSQIFYTLEENRSSERVLYKDPPILLSRATFHLCMTLPDETNTQMK